MNVLLINPKTGYYNRALSNPLGLLSIGSHLKRIGCNVKIVDRCVEKVNLDKLFNEFRPEIVGISVMSSRGLKDSEKLSAFFKAKGVPVAWGGQFPSLQVDICLDSGLVDYVMIGEGEFTFQELLEVVKGNMNPHDVKSLAFKENGKNIITPDRPFADLSEMPILDWTLIKTEKYLQPYLGCKRMLYLYSSKGCPCRCAFCSNSTFHKSTLRKRPDDYVIEELKYLIKNHNLDGVYFSDELWRTKKEDVASFCRKVHENNLDFHWGVQLRIGLFGEEEFQMMYDAGCRWIFFGVETGNREMMKTIHKNIELEQIKPTLEILKKIGITTVCSFIIGYPDETEEQVRDTVDILKKTNANLTPIFHFTPLPGTELYDKVVAEGRYTPPSTLKEASKIVATESIGKNLSKIPTRDLRVIRSTLHWQSFSKKDSIESSKSFEFAIQTILSGLNSISKKGIISFFVDAFSAAKEFLYVWWYSHAYPKIKEKYNL